MAAIPEAGRVEAGLWKECLQSSTIPAQRIGRMKRTLTVVAVLTTLFRGGQ